MNVAKPLFPRDEVEGKLRSWWKRKTESPLTRKKPDPGRTGGSVFDIQPEVSSLEAIQVFIEVEPLLGLTLKSDVVKPGGYASCDEFVQHLLSGLEAKFNAMNSVTKGAIPKSPERTRAHAG